MKSPNQSKMQIFSQKSVIFLGSMAFALLGMGSILPTNQADAATVKYRYPLSVNSGLTNYRDDDSSSKKVDWNGGQFTYNTHEGTDFAVPKGNTIYASADGTVEEVVDGKYDDCNSSHPCSSPSNRVKLRHSDGQITYYLHMKKWSIVVKKGQKVKCGQKIGQVGSSGRSTGYHVHFQVGAWRASKEPFKGPRGASVSLWTVQNGYGNRGVVPGTKCSSSTTPSCSKNTDCKDANKPICSGGQCIPKPPVGCPYVKTFGLGGLTLNMRASSNTSSSVVGAIPEGVCLAVIKLTQGQSIQGKTTWYQVKYNGVTGWVTAAFANCSNCGGVCSNGTKRSCYSGPKGTDGKGSCKKGSQTCKSGQWGGCSGQITPRKESCGNGKDDDCDGNVDEGCSVCKDGDSKPCTTTNKGVCLAGKEFCQAGKWKPCRSNLQPSTEICDGKDNDCDGNVDEGVCTQTCKDEDKDGYGVGGQCQGTQDCDDTDKLINPGAKEICQNQKDDNCDGQTDENCQTNTDCNDNDKDGFKAGRNCPLSTTLDCDDNHKMIHPGAKETCGNNVDEDCNGTDMRCLDMGAPNCKHDGECITRFCFSNQGHSVCSKKCRIGECPTGYLCTNDTGCWPMNTGRPDTNLSESPQTDKDVIRLHCNQKSDCKADENCVGGKCISDKFEAKGCGCSQNEPTSPIFPLLLIGLFLFGFRKRQRGDSKSLDEG